MYTLFCYDKSADMYCEYKSFDTLKGSKKYVDDSRNENYLLGKMYIRSNTRVVKRYNEIGLPKL